MNQLDPFKTKKKKGQKYQNFIEAFKDSGGSSSPTQPALKTPQENFNFEDYLKAQERKIKHQERTRFEAIRREEKIIYSREQQTVKIQIETIQTQIKELAKEHLGLIKEVEQASFQAVVNPGVYHQNFFERLLHLIKLAKKKIVESRTWLQLHNRRTNQKKGYWGGVKKGGTSFMLSGERTVSTQTG